MAQKGIIKNSTSADVGAPELASCFGALIGASGILPVYSKLACSKVNDNTVQLAAGVYNLSGYLLEVSKATTVNLTIASGSAGQNRNDMVVAEFVRNGGGAGIDTLQFKIVQGVSTSGTPADPTLTQQDINGAGVTRQEALWRVKIVGTTLTTIEAVASVLSNDETLKAGGSATPFTNMPFVGTAPIVESGSNANGSYVKYADGTMICWKIDTTAYTCTEVVGSIFRTPTNTVFTFPVPFYAFPAVVPENTGGGLSSWVGMCDVFVDSVGLRGMGAMVTSTIKYGYVAFGRWKA